MTKIFPFSILGLLFVFLTAVPAFSFEVSGLLVPESFIVDEDTGIYYISNINGGPTEKNGKGFITRLNPDGSISELKFIKSGNGSSLNAPKGLVIAGDVLYVSDIDHIKGFDKKTGKAVADFDLTSFLPKFLNDIAVDRRGKLYVTDMGTNRIFMVDPSKGGKTVIFAESEKLGSPNGITFEKKTGKFLLATWDSGELFRLSSSGKLRKIIKQNFTALDGVDYDEKGNIYFSSFKNGIIYKLTSSGKLSELVTGLVTPADISLDRKKRLILVPSFNGNRAFTLDY